MSRSAVDLSVNIVQIVTERTGATERKRISLRWVFLCGTLLDCSFIFVRVSESRFAVCGLSGDDEWVWRLRLLHRQGTRAGCDIWQVFV